MSPGTGQFDIYQAPGGVTAVTSPVQRQILAALAEGDLQLPELMAVTGKAKSTLSSVHMKELLNRELVVELPHPTDNRRKVYRLNAAPLGSSEVSVDTLRSAVAAYARNAVPQQGVPLAEVVGVLAAGGTTAALRAQARALGARYAGRLETTGAREFASSFARFVEEEHLAHHLQLDFEGLSFRCRPGDAAAGIPGGVLAEILAGLAEGAAAAGGLTAVAFRTETDGATFRLHP